MGLVCRFNRRFAHDPSALCGYPLYRGFDHVSMGGPVRPFVAGFSITVRCHEHVNDNGD